MPNDSDGPSRLQEALRTLEDAAKERSGAQSCSRRRAARIANTKLHGAGSLTSQRISDWLAKGDKARVPRDFVRVWALVQVWAEWAGERQDPSKWVRLVQNAQPATNKTAVESETGARPTMSPPPMPLVIGRVPELANAFQVRHEAGALRHALSASNTAVINSPAQVLSGMFGVGKTQLAAEYARDVMSRRSLNLLLWITATQRERILAAYADAVATVLKAKRGGTSEENADRFLTWLTTTPQRWLIVLDDLTRPSDLVGLWPPHTTSGRTIVTTKWRDAVLDNDSRQLVTVGPFTLTEATRYLDTALRRNPELADDARGVAMALGRHPLALSHASAYMINEHESCSGYLRLLATRGIALSDIVADEDALPDDYARTIDATWSLSVDAANRLRPAGMARPLLDFASALDPNGTPVKVYTNSATCRWLSQGQTKTVDMRVSRNGLHCLERLNLIAIDNQDGSKQGAAELVRVHALVQRVTQDHLGDRKGEILTAAASAVEEACATDEQADNKLLAMLVQLADASGDGDRLRRAFNRLLDMIDRKYDEVSMTGAWEATYALQATIEIVLPLVLECLDGKKTNSLRAPQKASASHSGTPSFVTQEAASTLTSAFASLEDWRTAKPETAIPLLSKGLKKWELRKRFIEALAMYLRPDALEAILDFAANELDGHGDRIALDAAAVALGRLGGEFGEAERNRAISVLSGIAALGGVRRKTVRSAMIARGKLTGIPEVLPLIDEEEMIAYLSPTSERGEYSDWVDAQWYAEYVASKLAPKGISASLGAALLRAFGHRHQVVRVAVARCLGHLDDPRAHAALKSELQRSNLPADLRQACVEALTMQATRHPEK